MNKLSKQNLAKRMEGENLFAKQATITRLLQSIELSDYDISRIDRTYTIGPDRNGVVVILKDKKTEQLLKATIDIKQGQPSWTQMMDLTFGIGEGSDIRIAVYDESNSNNTAPEIDEGEYLAESFISILTGCGLKAYLVGMDVRLRNGQSPEIQFSAISDPEERKTSFNKLPSRDDFEKAEFHAVYQDSFCPSDPPIILEPFRWFGEIEWGWSGPPKTTTTWDGRGLVLEAIFETPEELEMMNWLWANKQREIFNHYKGCKVNIEKGVNGGQNIVVTFFHIPFRNFVLANKEDKETLTETFADADREFQFFMSELIDEVRDDLKARSGKV